MRLPRHPRASWALIAATVLAVFNDVGMPIFMNLMMSSFSTFRSTSELWLRTIIFTVPQAILGAVTWGLVLFAIFDRPQQPKFLRNEDPDRDILDAPRSSS